MLLKDITRLLAMFQLQWEAMDRVGLSQAAIQTDSRFLKADSVFWLKGGV